MSLFASTSGTNNGDVVEKKEKVTKQKRVLTSFLLVREKSVNSDGMHSKFVERFRQRNRKDNSVNTFIN